MDDLRGLQNTDNAFSQRASFTKYPYTKYRCFYVCGIIESENSTGNKVIGHPEKL